MARMITDRKIRHRSRSYFATKEHIDRKNTSGYGNGFIAPIGARVIYNRGPAPLCSLVAKPSVVKQQPFAFFATFV